MQQVAADLGYELMSSFVTMLKKLPGTSSTARRTSIKIL